jgi:hypothetical protein
MIYEGLIRGVNLCNKIIDLTLTSVSYNRVFVITKLAILSFNVKSPPLTLPRDVFIQMLPFGEIWDGARNEDSYKFPKIYV